ncbi:uncharacterized protein [Montipora capricornis]|uniref:uncharacterized protein n=1 Tax=Montipora capricornis TaxID=246305 RepID=UPI0035F1A295
MAKSLSSFHLFAGFLIVFKLLPKGFSLECHTCFSTKSWDDCLENSWVFKCPDDYDTCLMTFTSKLRTNGQQLDEFAKTCWFQEKCNDKKCREEITDRKQHGNITANYCSQRCCTEDRCNTGIVLPSIEGASLSSTLVINCMTILPILSSLVVNCLS